MESDFEFLKNRFRYDPSTGLFIRTKSVTGNKGKAGNVAGSKSGQGYILINFRGKKVGAHRLAWLYMTGNWPDKDIDHMNCNRIDNRWVNLRIADDSLNAQNQRSAHSNSGTGLLGSSKCGSKFRAQILIDGKVRHIGLYDSAEDAHLAYLEVKRKHHAGSTI